MPKQHYRDRHGNIWVITMSQLTEYMVSKHMKTTPKPIKRPLKTINHPSKPSKSNPKKTIKTTHVPKPISKNTTTNESFKSGGFRARQVWAKWASEVPCSQCVSLGLRVAGTVAAGCVCLVWEWLYRGCLAVSLMVLYGLWFFSLVVYLYRDI